MNYFIRLFLIISLFFLSENKSKPKYRCGTNDLQIKPKKLKPKFKINKESSLFKRRLDDIDEEGFKSFKIYIDKNNIKKQIAGTDLKSYQDIILNSLDKAAGTLQKLLRIQPLLYGYQFTDEELLDLDLIAWDKSKFGDQALAEKKDMNTLGIDLVIFPIIDEMEETTIAAATPIYTQNTNSQPILGVVYINSLIDFEKINVEKYLDSTLIHEMTHILGFLGEFFDQDFGILKEEKDKFGIKRQYIKSPKVLEVARKYFNCESINGVELENYGGEGTAGSHWEARILMGDYMNGVAYTEEVISEFTLALLEDTGIYKPHYYTGGLMRYGKNKGCEFVYEKCVNDYKINPKFENEFFDYIYSDYDIDASCSSGRLSRTYNILYPYKSLPKDYQYFEDKTLGGWGPADYCPLPGSYEEEEYEAYYVGICSGKETGYYGSQIFYDEDYYYETNEEMESITGEEISDHSFCFLSSLFKEDIDYVDFYSSVVRANCYKIFCSERSLSLKINDDYIVCPRAGGKIKVDGYEGYLLCPDYNLMCSGTVICNDLFDCVDKKSEVKEESYIYDYEIKTSQSILRAEESEEDDLNNYELSDDGICPKYCKHCIENRICLKCKEDYDFVGNAETEELKCVHKDELTVGYLFNDEEGIYYKCLDDCDICSDLESCDTCKDGYEFLNNKCVNLNIPHCEEYDENGICVRCSDNYGFKEIDRSSCYEKEIFKEKYYTKDDGISYFPCSNELADCDSCEYDPIHENIECLKCKIGYVVSIGENKCLSKSKIDKEKKYFYVDDFSIQKCSDVLINCVQCSNESYCDVCVKNTYFIDYNRTYCARKYEIYSYEYFLSDDKTTYLSCDIYNSVDNCIECDDVRHCNGCKSGYKLKRNKVCKYIETDSDDEDEENDNILSYGKNINFSLLYLYLFILIMC